MCSHRSRPITEPVPSTPSYVRQSLSTVRVIQILSRECPDDLSPLPVVPWALSLAMANAYRQFRQSKLPTHRSRAKSDLQTCCDMLQKMRSVWWSAGAMADLGNAALKKASKPRETDKVSDHAVTRKNADKLHEIVTTQGDTEVAIMNGNSSATKLAENTQMLKDLPLETTTALLPIDSSLSFANGLESGLSLSPAIDAQISPDWLNFDQAFENFDAVLGSSGADQSMELLRPFNFEDFGSFGLPED
jgi:hypothetical protein